MMNWASEFCSCIYGTKLRVRHRNSANSPICSYGTLMLMKTYWFEINWNTHPSKVQQTKWALTTGKLLGRKKNLTFRYLVVLWM